MFFRTRTLLDLVSDQDMVSRALVTYPGASDATPALRFDAVTSRHPLALAFQELQDQLCGTEMGNALVLQAKEFGYEIEFDTHRDDGLVQIDTVARRLLLPGYDLSEAAQARSVYFLHEFQWNILRGLRLIDLAENMRLPRLLRPDHMIRAVRLVAADQTAVAITLLWAIHRDMPGLWRHVLGGACGDMARYLTGTTQKMSHGLTAHDIKEILFAWYADQNRVSAVDQTTLALLDETLGCAKAPRLYQAQLTKQSIAHLCTLIGQTPYIQSKDHPVLEMIQQGPELDLIGQRHLHQIMNEQDVVMVHNVGFRDAHLARRIFPEA